jgi:hypothetical protein
MIASVRQIGFGLEAPATVSLDPSDESGAPAERPDQPLVYRRGFYRVFLPVLSASLIALFIGGETSGAVASAGDQVVAVLLLLVLPALLLCGSLRVRMIVDREGVRVVNYVRTYRIPWAEIDHFEGQEEGLGIVTRHGEPRPVVTVESMIRSTIRTARGKVDPVDQAAIALNAMVRAESQHHHPQRQVPQGGGGLSEEQRRNLTITWFRRLGGSAIVFAVLELLHWFVFHH